MVNKVVSRSYNYSNLSEIFSIKGQRISTKHTIDIQKVHIVYFTIFSLSNRFKLACLTDSEENFFIELVHDDYIRNYLTWSDVGTKEGRWAQWKGSLRKG